MHLRNDSQVRKWLIPVAVACAMLGAGACMGMKAERKGVWIEGKPGAFTLMREGKPYFVRGAGGTADRKQLLEAGANSIRTWGAEGLGEILDQAQKDGLTVTAGIWLGHREYFDYGNAEAVRKQFEECKAVVEKYKSHPALLMWSFGNEAEGDGKDPRVYRAINDIAAMAKQLDPHHPTMTVIAEIGDDKVRSIEELCPSIDLIGVNSYGGAPTLAERYAKQGGTKPYVVTEFGPLGHWEVPKTTWGAPIEATSTEKEAMYRKGYAGAVESAKGTCLGSYVFLWGNKQEATATWYGMFLPDGTRLGPVDVMTEIWTGKPPKNRTPKILEYSLSPSPTVRPNQILTAKLKVTDPESGALNARWVLSGEAVERLTAGRDEKVPHTYPELVMKSSTSSATIKAPSAPGQYRLFVYVMDDAGGAAVANIPFVVE